jgi:uncharacterized membrane protein YoaK (UPF0700 family)
VALGAFCLGALTGGRLATHVGAHRGRLLAVASAFEAVLVAGSVIVTTSAGSPSSGAARYALIVLLGLAMGTQNAVARKLAVPDLTTTVLTLTITGTFADGRLAGGASSKVGRRILSPLAMFVGGLGGALVVLRVSDALGIAVALVVLCLVAVTVGALSRTNRRWIIPR